MKNLICQILLHQKVAPTINIHMKIAICEDFTVCIDIFAGTIFRGLALKRNCGF